MELKANESLKPINIDDALKLYKKGEDELELKLERRRKRRFFRQMTNKKLPANYFQDIVELENTMLREPSKENVFDLANLYKLGVEYFAEKNFHLHVGFLQKFQNFITNRKFLQMLKNYPGSFLDQEANGHGMRKKRSNSDDIAIEKSNIQNELERKNKKKMSFVCKIKKMEVGDTKFNFHAEECMLEDNLATADNTIGVELIQQNINFLKRLEKKINRKSAADDKPKLKTKRKISEDLSNERISMERVMPKTLNETPHRLKSDNYVLSFKSEKYNLSMTSKQIESLINYNNSNNSCDNNKNNILDLSITDGKNKSFRVNHKDRVCQILDEFILGFTVCFRQNIIKKSLEVFKSIMNKKFEEKVYLFNNIHEQIASIEMMINGEINELYSNSMKQMLTSLENDNETELNKIKKEINFLVLILKKRSVEYFKENSVEFIDKLESEFVHKISELLN